MAAGRIGALLGGMTPESLRSSSGTPSTYASERKEVDIAYSPRNSSTFYSGGGWGGGGSKGSINLNSP